MKKIKIGRKTYDIQKGDYVMYNGKIYQFIRPSSDSYGVAFARVILAIRLKEIPFDGMRKIENKEEKLICWYF